MKKKRIQLTLTKPYLENMDKLVNEGVFLNRREVMKQALRNLFRDYDIKPFSALPKATD